MFGKFLAQLFGDKNTRYIKRLQPVISQINSFELRYSELSLADFPAQTHSFKERLSAGEELDGLLPEAFALAREAGVRTLGQRHYDVQLVGGIALHEGRIAEMRTGEGKTLVATLAAYLNALSGEGVHVVTVNDYLAQRDAAWMRPLYELLGLTVGTVVSEQALEEKQAAYQADITYCTNNELGFDYLRDNMVFRIEDKVQRAACYAIVDEVDSILIDEARTPLIISGPSEDRVELYQVVNKLVQGLEQDATKQQDKKLAIEQDYLTEEDIEAQGHYILDEKNRSIELTEKGHRTIEERLHRTHLLTAGDNLYSSVNLGLLHHVHAALKAQTLFRKNVDYLVRDGEIVIVDEHTGRALPGRRWSDGLHQAVEAKEEVSIHNESQTLASTTFQNYFRLYSKLAGMTGTADTEAFEFKHIYGLDVVIVPTNKPTDRQDLNDLIYLTQAEKFEAIISDIKNALELQRPVLVGTTSVAASEHLSQALQHVDIQHRVLNAKRHQQESMIIAQAGRPGAVTIATNMAGRGTDIVLGGNWEMELKEETSEQERTALKAHWQERHEAVLVAGGLHIIGTERHESRRIDNQLRGRSGRQGDPGSSQFYLSMEDDLMRIFASDRIRNIMQNLGLEHGDVIEHRFVNSAIERAQRKVEGRNFDIRKNLLEYDDVASRQRQVIYAQRAELVAATDVADAIEEIRYNVLTNLIDNHIPSRSLYEQWNIDGLAEVLQVEFNSQQPLAEWLEAEPDLEEGQLRERILEQVSKEYRQKEEQTDANQLRAVEKTVMLMSLDQLWKEHLAAMDQLREGIGLRAYAQKQPKQEYKQESFKLFQELLENIRYRVISDLARIQLQPNQDMEVAESERRLRAAQHMKLQHQSVEQIASPDEPSSEPTSANTPYVRGGKKIGRNSPCPCGSGKKYKQCHGSS